jgi:cytochrome c oxidase subunit II
VPLVGLRHRIATGRTARIISIALLAVLVAILAGCAGAAAQHPGFEPGYGPGAPGPGFFPIESVTKQSGPTESLYLATFIIAVIVFVLVEGLLLFITLRFRRKPTDTELPPQIHGSTRLELLWTIIPMITVTALFVAAIITLNEEYDVKAAEPDQIVDVTGFQWQWKFDYPEHGITLTGTGREGPVMALPVGETIRIRLHSADTDVIHSFYVPQFNYKLDIIPGRVNEFDVLVEQVGTYAGQCAEFCGFGHADMHFSVQAMTPDEFAAWVTQQQTPPSPSAQPSGAPPSGAPPSGAPTALSLTSISIVAGFEPKELSVPADAPWSVNLTNADASVPHDFSIREASPDGSDWVAGIYADGGGSAVYQPPPLAAGDYTFFCSLHTNMTGTLHVGQ